MRNPVRVAAYLLPAVALAALSGCSTVNSDRANIVFSTQIHTRVSFEPLTRDQVEHYLEIERHTYKTNTDPMLERKAAVERGREERYREVRKEFPECSRQKHCVQGVSTGDVTRFERFQDLVREINRYDAEIVTIDAALRDWKDRLDLRARAILNRFLVHEILQLPSVDRHFQSILPYSLESFETRRQLSRQLMRYLPDGEDFEPKVLGDYDFRMLGRPVDEAAVIATFEVYLMPPLNDFEQPTRYLVTMLINTWQLDLHYYDKDFLRAWAGSFTEPYQNKMREEVYCGIYSIAGETLAPRMDLGHMLHCTQERSLMRKLDAGNFYDRFPPERWLLPIAYYARKNP